MSPSRSIACCVVLVAACSAKQKVSGTAAPDAATAESAVDAAPGSLQATPSDLDTLEAQLGRSRSELAALGVALPTEPSRAFGAESHDDFATQEGKDGEVDVKVKIEADPILRCQRICALAEASCDLEGRICDLAQTHPDEPRYADACARASETCERASEACRGCAE